MDIRKLAEITNIAEELSDDKLKEIGTAVVAGYTADKDSRFQWEQDSEKWTKLALQVIQNKTYPWPNASNVKFPLVSIAAMQFAARAYPSLVPSDGKVVKCKIVGKDPTGEKYLRSQRVGAHMSYQLLEEMEDWEGDMDRLLVVLPIVGMAFKKTYYDPIKKRNCSNLVLAKNLVVNYWFNNIEDVERKTEVLYKNKREVTEKVRAGIYRDVKLPEPQLTDEVVQESKMSTPSGDIDETTPYTILEQHRWLDLDEDDLPEPYVVVVEKSSETVLRIAPRFTAEDIQTDEDGKIIAIKPIEYYTKYPCIPNPDGSGYDIGFGKLLGSLNESVDTIINQLIDSGTLNNLQAGFIGKGLRIGQKDLRFTPGEWKSVNAIGEDLKKQIVPLPANPPSEVLFKLLGMLIQSGKELASIAEIFVGKMPGQNTPAYTTKETVEQGMKLFTAIYKRVFRAMKREFQKLYLLNRIYMDPAQEVAILDDPATQEDYKQPADDIIPCADPLATSKTEKEAQSQYVLSLIQLGTVNPQEATKRALESMEIPQIEALMSVQDKGPPPEVQKMQMEMQMKQQEHQMKMQFEQQKLEMEKQKNQMELMVEQVKLQIEQARAEFEMKRMQTEHQITMTQQHQQHMMDMEHQEEQAEMDAETGMMDHEQSMQQKDEGHKQKMKQQKEQQKVKKPVDKSKKV